MSIEILRAKALVAQARLDVALMEQAAKKKQAPSPALELAQWQEKMRKVIADMEQMIQESKAQNEALRQMAQVYERLNQPLRDFIFSPFYCGNREIKDDMYRKNGQIYEFYCNSNKSS